MRAATVPGASIWAAPITAFCIYFISCFLCAVLINSYAFLAAAVVVSFLMSLFFAHTLIHSAILLLSVALAVYAMYDIKQDLVSSVKVRFFNSLMGGRSYFTFAVIIAVSSQYYAMVSRTGGEVNIPRFEISQDTALSLGKLYGRINPKYSFFSSAGKMTVDQFILQNQNAYYLRLGAGQSGATGEVVLKHGRKQLSELAGRPLTGSEQVADIFLEFSTRKFNDYFAIGMAQSQKSSPFPLLATSILFLTLLPITAIASHIGIICSALLCKLLLKKGLIRTKTTQLQVETLVE